MRRIVYKWFWVWQIDKEERWLNEMAAKGLCLVSVGFCRYEFEECLPGEYQVRMELLKRSINHAESQQYLSFMEETGVEQIGSWQKWVYFRKKTADGSFELFSDRESRVRHLSVVISLILTVGILNLWVGLMNLLIFFVGVHEPISLMGLLNLFLGAWCLFGSIRLVKKRKKLKREGQIFE